MDSENQDTTPRAFQPLWKEGERWESMVDVVRIVAHEGIDRLITSQMDGQIEDMGRWMEKKGVSRPVVVAVDNFYNDLALEIIEVSAQLGYALALTQPSLGSFEDWLQAATAKAHLAGYRLPRIVDVKIYDDLFPKVQQ